MQKKTLKFSFYLLFFSFIAKMLSFLSRILLARSTNSLAMSYYTIISPTIVILISLVQMGIPNVLSKFIADKKYEYKILSTSIYFTIFTTSLTTLIYLFMIPFLSYLLFKENLSALFYCVLPFLPLVALSGLCKGFLMGKQKFISSSFSQIIEEVSRIIFLLFAFYYCPSKDSLTLARITILSISVGEFFSSIFMLICIYLLKHKIYQKLQYSKSSLNAILKIAIPMSGSRFVGSFTYFLEPIVMGLGLTLAQNKELILSYGTLNGYVLPLLTMPSFISTTLASYLLPSYTYHYSRNNKTYANQLFYRILFFCFFVGLCFSLGLYFFSEEICVLFYNSKRASAFLKACSLPFIVYSIQPILSIMLHALGRSKATVYDTLAGSLIRLGIVAILAPILHEYALILGLSIGMIVTTFFHLIKLILIKRKNNSL